ncbi:hypothetical protein HG536_0F01030 [Torulaspora globosa]|uniref:Uncharacterized protein n=1 Tax=Torulaspora globosa TaxID=48254 RepID=A0A7G3ZJU2_9SACH|nr:uncharacterized protein HG536_0F01030 [Torulaspora globosa]QLL33778.1 hypothetical protein HG536_0F01030 [Torulaspora globosa]
MIAQATKVAAARASVAASSRIIPSAIVAPVFKNSPGNSFSTFKEYRENAKTYGPLSASLAARRHLVHGSKR